MRHFHYWSTGNKISPYSEYAPPPKKKRTQISSAVVCLSRRERVMAEARAATQPQDGWVAVSVCLSVSLCGCDCWHRIGCCTLILYTMSEMNRNTTSYFDWIEVAILYPYQKYYNVLHGFCLGWKCLSPFWKGVQGGTANVLNTRTNPYIGAYQ